MKKRTLLMMIVTMTLALSLFGCGSDAEPKQGEEQQEIEQDKEEQSNSEDVETDNFVFFSEVGEAKYGFNDFEWEECNIEFMTENEINVWHNGKNVGYIKSDVPVVLTEHGINSAWYRFLTSESGTDYDYLYVIRDDIASYIGEYTTPQVEGAGTDTGMLYIYPDDYQYGDDQEVSSDLTWEECNVEYTGTSALQLYSDSGKNIGWIHEDITITFTEENDEWYRFKNPENQIDSEYLLITKKSIESQKQYAEEQALYEEQDKARDEVLELVDTNKTYTVEEFHELMKQVCDVVGTEYSTDVAENPQGMPGKKTLNLNGEKIKQMFEDGFLDWLIWGPTGNNSMDVYFSIDPNSDTTGDFEAVMFARFHQ